MADELTTKSDVELVRRFVNHQCHEAFAVIASRHADTVWGVCARSLISRQDVEDAFQTTFLVFAEKASTIRNHSSVASWLYGTAYRVSLEANRTLVRQRLIEKNLDYEQALKSRSANPLAEIQLRYEFEALDRAVNDLPGKFKDPIVLYHFCGLSCAEIAGQLELTNAAVESRLRRGRSKLKVALLSKDVQFIGVIGLSSMLGSAVPKSLLQKASNASRLSHCSATDNTTFLPTRGLSRMSFNTLFRSTATAFSTAALPFVLAVGLTTQLLSDDQTSNSVVLDTTADKSSVVGVDHNLPVSHAEDAEAVLEQPNAKKTMTPEKVAAASLLKPLKTRKDVVLMSTVPKGLTGIEFLAFREKAYCFDGGSINVRFKASSGKSISIFFPNMSYWIKAAIAGQSQPVELHTPDGKFEVEQGSELNTRIVSWIDAGILTSRYSPETLATVKRFRESIKNRNRVVRDLNQKETTEAAQSRGTEKAEPIDIEAKFGMQFSIFSRAFKSATSQSVYQSVLEPGERESAEVVEKVYIHNWPYVSKPRDVAASDFEDLRSLLTDKTLFSPVNPSPFFAPKSQPTFCIYWTEGRNILCVEVDITFHQIRFVSPEYKFSFHMTSTDTREKFETFCVAALKDYKTEKEQAFDVPGNLH